MFVDVMGSLLSWFGVLLLLSYCGCAVVVVMAGCYCGVVVLR